MQTQLELMLELQDAMNTRVNNDWRLKNFEWYRAIWVECAELMDHYGWKWWKHQSPDVEQVKLELIDIWHFGLSILLERNIALIDIMAELESALDKEPPTDFKQALEAFTLDTLANKHFSIALFMGLIQAIGMSYEDLYCGYVGKNVLNFFRQDHGYQDGSYKKVWAGKEDNEHLVELVQDLDTSDSQFSDKLYAGLKLRYTEFGG